MRGHNTESMSRWTVNHELDSVSEGIEEDLQNVLGQSALWYRFDARDTRIDPVYDVGDYESGRIWQPPVTLRVLRASIEQGQQFHNDRGFYPVDNLYLIVNYSEFVLKLPNMTMTPDGYLRDRIVFRDEVFHPTSINPRTYLKGRTVTSIVQATQVKPDEMVNDPQFNWKGGTDITGTTNRPMPVENYPTPTPDGPVFYMDDLYGTG